MRRHLVLLSLVLTLGGCVSKHRYNTDIAALSAQLKTSQSQVADLKGVVATKEAMIAKLKDEIASDKAKITDLGTKLVLTLSNDVLFQSGSYRLSPEGTQTIEKVADVLGRVDQRTIRVEGYTDNVPVRPDASYPNNWALSSLRASSVVRLLVDDGVSGDNIAAVGFGEQHPVASNDTPDGRAANRRTVIVLVPQLSPKDVAPDAVPTSNPTAATVN